MPEIDLENPVISVRKKPTLRLLRWDLPLLTGTDETCCEIFARHFGKNRWLAPVETDYELLQNLLDALKDRVVSPRVTTLVERVRAIHKDVMQRALGGCAKAESM